MDSFRHTPVLLNETIEALNIREDGIYVDGTLGGGGHSSEIAKRLVTGKLIGMDQDDDALKASGKRLEAFGSRVEIVKSNFEHMNRIIHKLGFSAVDGILLDLGVSSFQLDEAARGFSYRNPETKLDMRMDRDKATDAVSVLNTYDEKSLTEIFKSYGEERFAKRIAQNIVKKRQESPIETAGELNNIINEAIPAKFKRNGHPSKRVYQALRIEVNDELTVLKNSIDGMIDLLACGGRLCIITFHSLEDRIVKNAFRKNEDPCECPKNLPMCVCGRKSKGRVVTRKPVLPSEDEMKANSRSKSAKLRVFEKGCNGSRNLVVRGVEG